MYTNKIIPQTDVKTQEVRAFGVTFRQSAMALPEPAQASLAPSSEKTHTQASNAANPHNGPQSYSDGSLSLVQRLQRQQLKFEQLHARANVRWQRFWSSQILDCRTRLAAIAANDSDLAGKLKQRLTNYESKLAQEKDSPWAIFYRKEISDCQTRLKELESE